MALDEVHFKENSFILKSFLSIDYKEHWRFFLIGPYSW